MILNRLVVPEGNYLVFTLNHMEGGEQYELKPGEMYYMSVAPYDEPHAAIVQFFTNTNHFNMRHGLDEGRYVFEIGVIAKSPKVILPSVDERRQPLNELIILKKMDLP